MAAWARLDDPDEDMAARAVVVLGDALDRTGHRAGVEAEMTPEQLELAHDTENLGRALMRRRPRWP